MKKLNKKDFFNRYGSTHVMFSSYFKNTWVFKGDTISRESVTVFLELTHEDQYDFEIDAKKPISLDNLDPTWGYVEYSGEKTHEYHEDYS